VNTSDATPDAGALPADSIEAAALSFRALPSLAGTLEKPAKPTAPKVRAPGLKKVEPETPEPITEESDVEEPEADEAHPETETDETPESDTEETPEAEEPEAEPDETEEPEPTPPVRSRKVKNPDGTEEDVTEDEAYNGYLRQKDYTQKTQATAAEKKAAAEEARQAREKRGLYSAQLDQVIQAMDSVVPQEPNWVTLRATVTPEEFAQTWADYQTFTAKRNAVIAEQKKVIAETDADFKKQVGEFQQQEVAKILEVIPSWRDPKVAQTELEAISAYAQSLGYAKEEINNVIDSRVILGWRKAMQWDRLQAAKPGIETKLKGKPGIKTAPPGSPAGKPPVVSAESKARKALRSSGSIDDAASLFKHVIARGRK
jgi:hypothetical protein